MCHSFPNQEELDRSGEFAQEHFEATMTGASSELQSGGVQWGCSRKEAVEVWWETGVVPDCTVPAWSYPSSLLSEIPRPTLTDRCSREDFNIFKIMWRMYVRYYGRVAKTEDDIRDQLFSCLSKAIQKPVYEYFGQLS